jgi:hypothetical protein
MNNDRDARNALLAPSLALLVGLAALYAFAGGLPQNFRPAFYYHGWPILFLYNNGGWARPNVIYFSSLALLLDAAISVAAVTCTWVVGKRMAAARGRFSLRTAMLLVAVSAAICALVRAEPGWAVPAGAHHFFAGPPSYRASPDAMIKPPVPQPIMVRAPLYFGLGCALYVCLTAFSDRRAAARPIHVGQRHR